MKRSTRLISVPELRKLPPTKYLGSTHFIERGLNVLFGPSGSFKTFYMLDQALWIAQSQPVVYIAAEGVGGMAKRVDAWEAHYGLPTKDLVFLPGEVDLRSVSDVGWLVEDIITNKPKVGLIVFDTYARCIPGGDENSAKDTGLVIQQCAKIQRTLETGIGLVHHSNRAERGERGSGALRGAADVMIQLYNADGLISVECEKVKDDEPWPLERYRFLSVGPSGVLVNDGEVPESDENTLQQLRVLEFLSMGVFKEAGAPAAVIGDSLNLPKTTRYRILSELKDKSQIVQEIRGDPFRISGLGQAALVHAGSKRRLPKNVIEMNRLQA